MGRSCGSAAAPRRCRAVRVGPGEHAPSDPDGSILDRTPSPRGRACRLVMPSVAYTTTPSIGTGLDKAAVGCMQRAVGPLLRRHRRLSDLRTRRFRRVSDLNCSAVCACPTFDHDLGGQPGVGRRRDRPCWSVWRRVWQAWAYVVQHYGSCGVVLNMASFSVTMLDLRISTIGPA